MHIHVAQHAHSILGDMWQTCGDKSETSGKGVWNHAHTEHTGRRVGNTDSGDRSGRQVGKHGRQVGDKQV